MSEIREGDRRPLLVVDKASTSIMILGAFAGVVLWAFTTLNGPTDERSKRNEKGIEKANAKFDAIHTILLDISRRIGDK